jgi:hypothetical protein
VAVGTERIRRVARDGRDRHRRRRCIEVRGLGRDVADGLVRIFSEDDGGAAAIEPVDVIEAMDLAERACGLAIGDVVLTRVAALGRRWRGCGRRDGDVRGRRSARDQNEERNEAPQAAPG